MSEIAYPLNHRKRIGEEIKNRHLALGMIQEDLAKATGLLQNNIKPESIPQGLTFCKK